MSHGELTPKPAEKPQRLYFDTYLQMIENSVGSALFRNFYVRTETEGKFDALGDGSNSCAFYVSSVLRLVNAVEGVHGTVASVLKDLETSGWSAVSGNDIHPGDVIFWEAQQFADGTYEHIGFAVQNGQATSTSLTEKVVVKHDLHFGETNRAITQVWRKASWD